MKKATFMAVAALTLGAAFFTSCKKDFTCVCTYKDANGQSQSVEYPFNNTSKPTAKTACEAQNIATGATDWSCKLK